MNNYHNKLVMLSLRLMSDIEKKAEAARAHLDRYLFWMQDKESGLWYAYDDQKYPTKGQGDEEGLLILFFTDAIDPVLNPAQYEAVASIECYDMADMTYKQALTDFKAKVMREVYYKVQEKILERTNEMFRQPYKYRMGNIVFERVGPGDTRLYYDDRPGYIEGVMEVMPPVSYLPVGVDPKFQKMMEDLKYLEEHRNELLGFSLAVERGESKESPIDPQMISDLDSPGWAAKYPYNFWEYFEKIEEKKGESKEPPIAAAGPAVTVTIEPHHLVRGDFAWKDASHSAVEFKEDPDGKFRFAEPPLKFTKPKSQKKFDYLNYWLKNAIDIEFREPGPEDFDSEKISWTTMDEIGQWPSKFKEDPHTFLKNQKEDELEMLKGYVYRGMADKKIISINRLIQEVNLKTFFHAKDLNLETLYGLRNDGTMEITVEDILAYGMDLHVIERNEKWVQEGFEGIKIGDIVSIHNTRKVEMIMDISECEPTGYDCVAFIFTDRSFCPAHRCKLLPTQKPVLSLMDKLVYWARDGNGEKS